MLARLESGSGRQPSKRRALRVRAGGAGLGGSPVSARYRARMHGFQSAQAGVMRRCRLLLSSKKPGVCRAFCLLLLMLFDRAASSLLSLHCGVSLC